MTATPAEERVHRVRLDGALTVRDGDALRVRLLEALRAHAAIEVDGRAVTAADLGALQLLVSARRSAQAWGRGFTLLLPDDGGLRGALARAGLLAPDDSATQTMGAA